MTPLLYLLGVVIFVVAILASIGLHELGHMIPAKKFGGKVTQYFIGFGPTVWSTRVGETEYGLKAIPLGGYVKIVGMLPPAAEELADQVALDAAGNQVTRVRKSNTGMFTQLISDARAAEWELVGPQDADRLFYKMPWWKKVVVMAGGPTVNIVLAFLAFLVLFGTYGERREVVADGPVTLGTVSRCVLPYAEEGRECSTQDDPTPAVEAGLRPGDRITTFNGVAVTDWAQLRELIRRNGERTAVIGYERDGRRLEGRAETTVEARPLSAEDQTLTEVGFLGVTPSTEVVVERGGPLFTLARMGEMTKATVVGLGQLPVKVWGVAKAVVGLEERERDSPVSIVGGGRLAGETVAHRDFAVAEKAAFLLTLVGGFNLFIGLFNFIPLLPLDGGHIASALWEAVRRGAARLVGRPDPGYVDAAKLLPVAYVVALALVLMGSVLIVADLVVPLHLDA